VNVQGKFPVEEKLLCASKEGTSSPCIFVGSAICYAHRKRSTCITANFRVSCWGLTEMWIFRPL